MIKLLFFLFLIPMPPRAVSAAGISVPSGPVVSSVAPVSYDYGMEQRKHGEYAAARETFLKLLAKDPSSVGALEGLALTCMSLGQYEEALGYLERWDRLSPHNTYVLGLLVRTQDRLRDEDGALNTYREIAACNPGDCAAREAMDSGMERLRGGIFPYGKSYKSYSMEDLDTPSPQRILYEGNSAGTDFRVPLKSGLDLIGGADLSEEAQRNETTAGRNFTYYDILDQTYSAGLSGRPSRDLSWEAEYGQAELYDLKGSALGNTLFSKARLAGEWHTGESDLKLSLTRSPEYLRGYDAGGDRYFRLLAQNAARAEDDFSRWDWDWTTRAGFYNTSDGSNLVAYSMRGLREFGDNVFQSGYFHGQQEFYSGSVDRKLQYVNTDDLNLGIRHGVEETYRVGASYDYTFYSDTNRQGELDGELTGWLPWDKEFYGTYRYSLQDFRAAYSGYNSTSTRAHWLGAYWRRCHGRNWSATLGYERGFLYDLVRRYYQGNSYLAGLDWYRGANFSIRVQGRMSDTTVRDHSYSAGLQARCSFR